MFSYFHSILSIQNGHYFRNICMLFAQYDMLIDDWKSISNMPLPDDQHQTLKKSKIVCGNYLN